jgi:hypothetical protein
MVGVGIGPAHSRTKESVIGDENNSSNGCLHHIVRQAKPNMVHIEIIM